MAKKVLNIYKPAGLTPLEAIERFRKKYPKYEKEKLGYAGRLDPLAEGVLIVPVGEELKKQTKYMKLDKEYQAKILFGFSTDTFDILGLPSCHSMSPVDENKLKDAVKIYKGENTFSFPPYSSPKIGGKPLFWWARNNRLDEIELPKITTKVYEIEVLSLENISKDKLEKSIIEKVNSVNGDFRQVQIKLAWIELLKNTEQAEFPIADIKITCSSGTYIRTLAHEMGKDLGGGAVLYHLFRSKVGNYKAKKSITV